MFDAKERQYVIWTRYEKPDGGPRNVVRHVYGPYPTRSKALTQLKNMVKNFEDETCGHDPGIVESQVVELIGLDKPTTSDD